MTIQLGTRQRDAITGYEGVAIARCEYLTGCTRYELQATGTTNGAVIAPAWFDETRLEGVDAQGAKPGGHANPPGLPRPA